MARGSARVIRATLEERVTALEIVWEDIGDKVLLAISKAAEKLASRDDHDRLTARVAVLESTVSHYAGAVKVEERGRTEAQEWMRLGVQLAWPTVVGVIGVLWMLTHGGGLPSP